MIADNQFCSFNQSNNRSISSFCCPINLLLDAVISSKRQILISQISLATYFPRLFSGRTGFLINQSINQSILSPQYICCSAMRNVHCPSVCLFAFGSGIIIKVANIDEAIELMLTADRFQIEVINQMLDIPSLRDPYMTSYRFYS